MATIKTKWNLGDKVWVFYNSTIRQCTVISIEAYVHQNESYCQNRYFLRTMTNYDLGKFEENQLHKTEASVIKSIKRA